MGYAIAKKEDFEAAEFLAQMASLMGKEDKEQAPSLPRIKINYDVDSAVTIPGEWVVGQKKNKDGGIEEQGSKAVAFISIVVRNSYSYYNQKDIKLNCNSPLFDSYDEQVTGSRLKNVCGKTCPMRVLEDNKCNAQKVIFGVAVTADGKFVDCVGYFSGIAFMPLDDHVKSCKFLIVGGKKVPTPICSHVASLSSTKEKNGSITYFIPVLNKVGILAIGDIEKLVAKREDIYAAIDSLNKASVTVREAESTKYTKVDPDTIEAEIISPPVPSIKTDNIASMFTTPASDKKESIPFSTSTETDPDIAAAIANALGSM